MGERNPFRFHNGKMARSVDELIACCKDDQEATAYHLRRDDFERWFTYLGYDYLAAWTAGIREEPDVHTRVKLFTSLSPVLVFLQKSRERRLTFLLVGRTGVGKSSAINYFLGKEIAPVGDHVPVTAEVISYDTEIYGVPVRVTDTPGLCDGTEKNTDYLADMRAAVEDKGLDCCWFVSILTENRVRDDEVKALRDLTQAFGVQIWNRSVVVLTHADWIPSQAKYTERLQKRTDALRDWIKRLVAENGTTDAEAHRIAADIPVVGVTNENERTPAGVYWLGELFQKTLDRMPPVGAGSLLMATAERITFDDGIDAPDDGRDAPALEWESSVPRAKKKKKKKTGKVSATGRIQSPPGPANVPIGSVSWSTPVAAPRLPAQRHAHNAEPASRSIELPAIAPALPVVGEVLPAQVSSKAGRFHEVREVAAPSGTGNVNINQRIVIENHAGFDRIVDRQVSAAVGTHVQDPSRTVLAIARAIDKGAHFVKRVVRAVIGLFN